MTNNVKASMPSEIDKLLPWGLAKMCKNTVSFFKKMVVNRYSNHVYVYLIVCRSTIFILCIVIKLCTINYIRY